MKIRIDIAVFGLCGWAYVLCEPDAMWLKYIPQCAIQERVSVNDLDAVLRIPGAPIPPYAQLKCGILCYMQKMGYMDVQGNLNMAKVKANTRRSPDMYVIMEQCNAEGGKDACDHSYRINNCIGLKMADIRMTDSEKL